MKKVIILLALVVALTGCFGKKDKDKEKDATTKQKIVEVKEEGVIENKEYSGIKIEDISFNYDGSYSNMSFNIINSRSEVVTIGRYDVIIKNANGEEIGKLESYLPNEMQPEELLEITLSLDKDFTKAKSVEFDFISLNQQ